MIVLSLTKAVYSQYKWSEPVQLSEEGIYPEFWHNDPAITVNNDGALHAFWVKNIQINNDLQWYSQIEYRYSADGGLNWGITQNLTPEYTDNRIYEIQAVCDSLNNVHLFYLRGAEPNRVWYKKFNGMYWTEPFEISNSATKRIRPVFDRNGRLYLTWNLALTAYYTYSDLTDNPPVWQEPKAINEGLSLETYLHIINYTFDNSNKLYAIGQAYNGDYYVPVYFQYDSITDTWHSFEVFDEYTEASCGIEMTISNNDTLYVNILVGNMNVNRNYIQKKYVDDTDWSEPEYVNENNSWDYRYIYVDNIYKLHLFETFFSDPSTLHSALQYTNNVITDDWNIYKIQMSEDYYFPEFNVSRYDNDYFYVAYKKWNILNKNTIIYFLRQDVPADISVCDNKISDFKLYQNYPNPFNNTTAIKYDTPYDSNVELTIYNSLGEKVSTLEDSRMKKGSYEINFNADKFNSGVYYYQLAIDGNVKAVNRMLYIK